MPRKMSTKGKNRKNNKEHKIRSDLQLIIDLDPEMIFIKDKKNYMMSTNKNFIGSFKIKNGHIERKTCFQLYPVQAEQYWQDDKERTMFNKDNASAPIITSINFIAFIFFILILH